MHWPIIRRLVRNPARVMIVDDRRAWRAGEILVAALHLASEIERRSESRTVATMFPASGAFPAAALACWMLGRTPVPLNFLLKPEELQYVVDDCEADLVISADAMLKHVPPPRCRSILRIEEVNFRTFPEIRWPARARDDDLAVLLYTSGTSGRPKGVMLTHGNISANIRQCCEWARFDERDTLVGVLPQFHSFGFTVLTMVPLTAGCKAVYSARFVPARVVGLIRDHKATVFVGIPSMYGALLTAKSAGPGDFRSLRFTVSGGEPLPDAITSRFRERFGITLNEGYGLTETGPVTNWCLPEDYVPHSVGKALPRIEERIVDVETGRVLEPGRDGEVRIKGPNIMKGYFKLPEQTAAVFDEEGFFRTGDIGRMNEDGHLFITGRLKEMLIVGGENVFPREIEEVLDAHPAVKASAVIGVMDEVRGELPLAFVELEEGEAFDEKALRAWCRDRLAGYKVPHEIRAIEALPRNPTGKIMRRELKGMV